MLSAIARLTANKLRNVPKKNNINSLSFNHFFRQQYNNFHIIKNTFTNNSRDNKASIYGALSIIAGAVVLLSSSTECLKAESQEENNIQDDDLNFIQYSGSEKNNDNTKNLIKNKRRKSGLQKISKFDNNESNDGTNRRSWKECSDASCYLTIGPRKHMEDEYHISKDGTFFAIYDGHGGDQVSKYLKDQFYNIYKKIIDGQQPFLGLTSFGKDYKDALLKTFQEIQKEIFNENDLDHVGSTCVGVLLTGSSIWSFNVGDSRAVLCRDGKAIDLTLDHKPNDAKEKQRILQLGGYVSWDGYLDEHGRPVPGHGCYRVNGNLAMSRAVGDKYETPYVHGIPDIKEFERKYTQDKFIIIASDGLWDVMTSQEAVDFVRRNTVKIGPLQLNRSRNNKSGDAKSKFMNGTWTTSINALLSEKNDSDASKKNGNNGSPKSRISIKRRREIMSQLLVEEAMNRKTQDNTTVIVVWLQ